MKNIYPAFLLLAVLSVSQGCSDGPDHEDPSKALQLEGAIGTEGTEKVPPQFFIE